MHIERKRGRTVFTPRAIELYREMAALQPAVDTCKRSRLKYPEGDTRRYHCDRPLSDCACTTRYNLRGRLNVELGITPWAGDVDGKLRELDRIAAADES